MTLPTVPDSATPSTAESAAVESVAFLRRFADILSGGGNAEKLHRAADAIEDLAERLAQAQHLTRQEAQLRSTYQALCAAAESVHGQLSSELALLKQHQAVQQEQQEKARTELVDANRQLSGQLTVAEAERDAGYAEIAKLQSQLRKIRSSMVAAPAKTMETAREQFQCLADELQRRDDMVLLAMCEVGKLLIEQAISERRAGERHLASLETGAGADPTSSTPDDDSAGNGHELAAGT
jgi:hypothetical protein